MYKEIINFVSSTCVGAICFFLGYAYCIIKEKKITYVTNLSFSIKPDSKDACKSDNADKEEVQTVLNEN